MKEEKVVGGVNVVCKIWVGSEKRAYLSFQRKQLAWSFDRQCWIDNERGIAINGRWREQLVEAFGLSK